MRRYVLSALVVALVGVASAADPINPADIPLNPPGNGLRDSKAHWAKVKAKYDGKDVSFSGKLGAYEDTARGVYLFALSTPYKVERGELLPITGQTSAVYFYVDGNSRPLYEEWLAAEKNRSAVNLTIEGKIAVVPENDVNGTSRLIIQKAKITKKEAGTPAPLPMGIPPVGSRR